MKRGGAEQVQSGGMSNLHSFPQCPKIDDLQHWLGQWQMTRQKYGADLPEFHLKHMFFNMLPESVAHKLHERKDLNSLQQYIDEVDSDLGRLNDAKLAKLHHQRMSTALRAGSRSPVNTLVEELPETPRETSPSTGSQELNQKLDMLVSVLSAKNNAPPRGRRDDNSARNGGRERSKSPRGIDPAWEQEGKGCLHCGMKGHQRKLCNKFKKLLADNGNSLPSGYKGAYKKWKDQRKKTNVAMIAGVDEELDDFAETDLVWSLPTRAAKASIPTLAYPCCPIGGEHDGTSLPR